MGVGFTLESRSGSLTWVFIYTLGGKRREIGLGSIKDIGLVEARAAADDMRALVASGRDVLDERRAALAVAEGVQTFKACCDEWERAFGGQWKSDGSRAEWVRHVGYCTAIWDIEIGKLAVGDVLRVVKLVSDRPAVAASMLSMIRRVCSWAAARGYRDPDKRNPGDRSLIGAIVPIKVKREHHAAMDYRLVGEFVRGLRARDT